MPRQCSLLRLFILASASPLHHVIALVVFVLTLCGSAQAQTLTLNPRGDTSAPLNSFTFGYTKLASTFVFVGDVDTRARVWDGLLVLKQVYRGSTIRSTTATFRDDEVFSLLYRSQTQSTWQPLLQTDAQVSRDSRSIGLSSLTRLNATAGLRYMPDSTRFVEVQTGFESNKLLGIADRGGLLRAQAQFSNEELDQFRLSSNLRSEFSIFPRRTNGDVDAALQLLKVFDASNVLGFNIRYRTLNREWYTQISSDTAINTLIEKRLEQRLSLEGRLLFAISQSWNAEILSSLSSAAIDRAFKDAQLSAPLTSAERSLSELQFSVSGVLNYRSPTHLLSLSVSSFSRDEQNTANRHFDLLSAAQLDTLQEQERVRDNTTWRTQWSLRSAWNLDQRDTLITGTSFSLLRYDTPSAANNDDRDELNSQLSLGVGRRFNDVFSANITARVQLNHIVFIKSQRSALNAWNRIVQLSPNAHYVTHFIELHPQFEVLAQYTVYDFDGKAGVPGSFVFRQLSYRDSIIVPLVPSVYAELRTYFRLFERGELYWLSFAELQQSRNYEQYLKVLLYSRAEPSVLVGAGVRFYALSQENLLQKSSANVLTQSVGPECTLSYAFSPQATLLLNGWYEFQFLNKVHTRNVPNMNLTLRHAL